ncbi:VOC family protein [Streptomyces sp. NBC_01275]|nr:VOC family protein [Streptomyces sp. NBC_01275]
MVRHRLRRPSDRLHRRDDQRRQTQDPLPARERAPPLHRDRRRPPSAVCRLPVDPVRTRVQHLNVQAASLDDLARSYERVHELGLDMALSVDQHTNDKELSYYARTPSGFEWEVGWNPTVIDETTWQPSTHQGISVWGHTPVGRTVVDGLDQFRLAARSLARPENTVTALSGAGRLPRP